MNYLNNYHDTAYTTMRLCDVVKYLHDERDETIFPENYSYTPSKIIENNEWKELDKDTFEGMIYARFWHREIGLETIDLFLLHFRSLFTENLLNYNRRNFLLSQDWDFLTNYKETETIDKTSENLTDTISTTDSDSETATTGIGTNELTPYTNYPPSTNYTANRDKAENESTTQAQITTDGASESLGSEQSVKTITALKDKTQAEIIAEFISLFKAVEKDFIDSLEECFLLTF